MILRKPYAFIIKHFRLIHIIMFICVTYITYRLYQLSSFLTNFINTGHYLFQANLVNKFMGIYLFIAAIVVIILSFVVIALFVWKKVDFKHYSLCILYYVLIIIGILFLRYKFDAILNTNMDTRILKLYRDVLRIFLLPGLYYSVTSLISGIGFNIKKFDFSKDLKSLNADVEDSEEFEFVVGKDNYKYKRAFNRFIRETSYYIKENTIFFYSMVGIVVISIGVTLYLTLYVSKQQYKINETFLANGVAYTVKDSYLTNLDYRGRKIANDKLYLIVKTNINNTSSEAVELNFKNFRLELLDGSFIYPITNKGKYFIDLGDPYVPDILPAKTNYDYMIIFEMSDDFFNGSYKYRIVNEIEVHKDNVKAAYKDTIVRPKVSDTIRSAGVFTLGKEAVFTNSALLKTNLTIKDVEIKDSFIENYKYCMSSKCFDGTQKVEANNVANGSKTLIRLNIDYYIDPENNCYVEIQDSRKLFERFGTITYIANGKKKTTTYEEITPSYITDDKIYLEVPSDVKDSVELQLNLTVRDKSYTFVLKN